MAPGGICLNPEGNLRGSSLERKSWSSALTLGKPGRYLHGCWALLSWQHQEQAFQERLLGSWPTLDESALKGQPQWVLTAPKSQWPYPPNVSSYHSAPIYHQVLSESLQLA